MTSAKIKLKVGSIELEYEGDPGFLKDGLESLLLTMTDLAKVAPIEEEAVDPSPGTGGTNGTLNVSTNTIAAHMDAKSGPELAMCAIANLELVQGKAGVSRSQINSEMKAATTYFNESMRKNLSQTLSSLTKSKRINQLGTDKYSLSATEKKTFEAKIAEIQ